MNGPKISVVIPVYNMEACLEQCLDSVQRQTLRDIEIICVDDCSQDGSMEILRRHGQQDDRIRICKHEHNKSVFVARKTGVAAATGEYILFLDSDDYLEETACQELYTKIRKENVDILHFSSQIFCSGAENPEQKQTLEKLLQSYPGKLFGADVFEKGFAKQKVWPNVVNKLYRGSLCKKAFAELPDAYYAVGEDLLTFCVIAYYAQSYMGWKSSPMYNYRIGNGISTGCAINLKQFQRQCVMAQVNQAMVEFCKERNVYHIAQPFVNQLRETWLNHCCGSWYDKLPKEYAPEGWDMLCRYWGAEEVVSHIARQHFDQRDEVARKLEDLPGISLGEKKIKTVGMYYHRMYNGGVERVISILAPMFLNMGYRVVVITDEPPRAEDFPLPEEVVREMVYDNLQTNAHNVDVRFAAWSRLVKKHSIDAVIYNAWMSDLLLWDMLYLKGMGVPVVVHTHGVFSCTIVELKGLFSELPGILRLADGIVTLSTLDKAFWDNYQANTHCIPNPVSPALSQAKAASWGSRNLVWIGRASPEKQPEKVLDIMQKVVARVPEAKLSILGSFDDPKWKKLVKNRGLAEHVKFCGMVRNVSDYLENASVYVSTSQFEGFPMSLVEAQAHRLPTVMFRIPNLTMAAPGHGVVNVDMNDVTTAAEEIVRLLCSEAHWKETSEQAYQSYLWLKNYDLPGAWQDVLSGKRPGTDRNETVAQMLDMVITHYAMGLRARDRASLPSRILRKIEGGIRCCEENGLIYTIGLAARKLRRYFKR